MRGFIVLCLCAVAAAAPQGYNYNGPAGGGGAAVSHSGFGSSGGFSGVGSTGGFSGSTGGFSQGGAGGGFSHGGAVAHQQAVVSKRFYIHTAPEDREEELQEKHITVGTPKKNYNVVFIKSPASSHKKTSIKISPAVNEEKTVIYVLNKKTDSSDFNAEVLEHAAPTSKPEVFFIKYKTQEEAAHAQQQIQAQYDALGGSSQVTDEGVAPVSSVIGSLGGGDAGHGAAVGGGSFGGAGASGGSFGGAGVSGGSFGGSIGGGSFSSGGHGASAGAGNAYLPPNFK